MERIKLKTSIGSLFIYYLITFCIVSVLLIFLIVMLYTYCMVQNWVRPANYYENLIENQRETIEKIEPSEIATVIPQHCQYVVYDQKGNQLQKNVSDSQAEEIWQLVQGKRTNKGSYFFKKINRKNELVVVRYQLVSSFNSPILQRYLPNPEQCFLILGILILIIEVIILARKFGKIIVNEMNALKEVLRQIESEQLDFEVKPSKIKEFNIVIEALDKMKKALKSSLSEQWQMENERKNQISALAHDIRTPLTVLKGNAELLGELNLDEEARLYNKFILKGASELENYIASLNEMMQVENQQELIKDKIQLGDMLENIRQQANTLCLAKDIKFVTQFGEVPETIIGNVSAINRVIMNVISNAITYTGQEGKISFSVKVKGPFLQMIIEDSGRGFNKEELTSATKQFFRGDKSRNSKAHYGMGLYIAKSFMLQHDGHLILGNSEVLKGAKVTLELPI